MSGGSFESFHLNTTFFSARLTYDLYKFFDLTFTAQLVTSGGGICCSLYQLAFVSKFSGNGNVTEF